MSLFLDLHVLVTAHMFFHLFSRYFSDIRVFNILTILRQYAVSTFSYLNLFRYADGYACIHVLLSVFVPSQNVLNTTLFASDCISVASHYFDSACFICL